MKFTSAVAAVRILHDAPQNRKRPPSARSMLFHWRSRDKTIYSPEVWITAQSVGNILAGLTLRILRSEEKRSPRRENWGGFNEKVCARSGIFPVRAAGVVRSGGSGHCV